MDLNNVYWFVKVVELGSMTQAAKYGGCAVSSISDRIKFLEKSLSVRLLERSTRQLRLTAAGEVFYERARLVVDSAEHAQLAVESWNEEPKGLLTVSATPEFTQSSFLPALGLMAQRHPQVTTRLLLTSERSNLLRENIDLAVRIGELEDSQLVARRLTTMSLSLVATKTYLKNKNSINHPDDLQQHNCIPLLSFTDNKIWPWIFFKEKETINFLPKGVIEVTSVGAGLDLARANLGVALVSNLLLKNIDDAELVSVLPDWQLPAAPVSAVYPSKNYISPKVRAFVDILQECLVENVVTTTQC